MNPPSSNQTAEELMHEARAAAATGDIQRVIQYLEQAVQKKRFHSEANSHLAWLYSQFGEYGKALPVYIRLQVILPLSFEIHARALQTFWFLLRKTTHRILARFKSLSFLHRSFLYYLSLSTQFLTHLLALLQRKEHAVSRWIRCNRRLQQAYSVNPFEYYKVSEVIYAASKVGKDDALVLDLGSGRSAFPAFLAERGYSVVVAELDTDGLQTQRSIASGKYPAKLVVAAANFLSLPFPDDTFDAITIISTIEHVPGDGDIQTVKELARCLKPGGDLIITVPCEAAPSEQWTSHTIGHVYQEAVAHGDGGGFLRVYDRAWLHERLVRSSGLQLHEIKYFGEKTRWGWLGLGRNFIDHNHIIHPSPFAGLLNMLFTAELEWSEVCKAHWCVACVWMKKSC